MAQEEVQPIIYQFWTGNNELTQNRKMALQTNANFGVKSVLVTARDLPNYVIKAKASIHPAYQFLSDVHKSDYLRCYFMHHFGGGYADIKFYGPDNNWRQSFELINENKCIDIVGQREIIGGSPILALNNPVEVNRLVANGYFIVRPHSFFSRLWYMAVCAKLDECYDILKTHPARSVFEQDYPLRWAELCGEILHNIERHCYFYNSNIVNISLRTGVQLISYR